MALQKQPVNIPLAVGIDQKSDDKLKPQGKLSVVENAFLRLQGKLEKRWGYSKLTEESLGADFPEIKATFGYKNELNVIGNNKLFSYSGANEKLNYKSDITNAYVESASVVQTSDTYLTVDSCCSGGFVCTAYQKSATGIYATIIDYSSKQPVIYNQLLNANAVAPRVIAIANYFHVYYIEGANLKFKKIAPISETGFSDEVTATNNVATAKKYDIIPFGSNHVIAYTSTDTYITIGYIKNNGGIATSLDGLPDAVTFTDYDTIDYVVSLFKYDQDPLDLKFGILLSKKSATKLYIAIYNNGLTKLAAEEIDGIVARNALGYFETASKINIFYEIENADVRLTSIKACSTNGLGVVDASGTTTVINQIGLYSRAFKQGDKWFCIGTHDGTNQQGYYLIDISSTTSPTVLTRFTYQNGSGLTNLTGQLANIGNPETDIYTLCSLKKTRLNVDSATLYTSAGINFNTISYRLNDLYQVAELGQSAFIAGGMLYDYDGQKAVEAGFQLYPEIISATPNGAGGNMEAGTRSVVAVYEYIDSKGQLHRSAPSIPVSFDTTGTTSKCVYVVTGLPFTHKTSCKISIYRTLANGTVYHKDKTVDNVLTSVSIEDTQADTAIESGEPLYTTGGTLENIPPPSCKVAVTYQNRLYLLGLEDPNEYWYSREYVQGECVNFSDILTGRIDKGNGGIQSGGVLDDKFIFYKNENPFAIAGQGPDDRGENNDYQVPQQIASDVGCPYPRSVVQMPFGLMFKSQKGWYLLDRSLQTKYIGSAVEDFNSYAVTSATLIDDLNEIRITHSDGNLIKYNYYHDQWEIDTVKAIAASKWNDTYHIVKTDNIIYFEDNNSYRDNGAFYSLRVVTPWLSMAGIQGYQRIYSILALGKYEGPHRLRVNLRYDFSEDIVETFELTTAQAEMDTYAGEGAYYGADTIYGGVIDHNEQFRIQPGRQKCNSIKVEILDLPINQNNTNTLSLTALTLIVGVKGGENKLANNKNFIGV